MKVNKNIDARRFLDINSTLQVGLLLFIYLFGIALGLKRLKPQSHVTFERLTCVILFCGKVISPMGHEQRAVSDISIMKLSIILKIILIDFNFVEKRPLRLTVYGSYRCLFNCLRLKLYKNILVHNFKIAF